MKTKIILFFYIFCLLLSASSNSDDNKIDITFKVTVQAGTCDIRMDDDKTDISFDYVNKDDINSTIKIITLNTLCSGVDNNKKIQLNFSTNQYSIDPNIATDNYIMTSKDNLSIGFYDEFDKEIPLNKDVNTNHDANKPSDILIKLKLHTDTSRNIETGPFDSSITIHANYN